MAMGSSRALRRFFRFPYIQSCFFSTRSPSLLTAGEHAGPSMFPRPWFFGSRGLTPRILLQEGYAEFVYSVTLCNMSTDSTKMEDCPDKQVAPVPKKPIDKDGSDSISLNATRVAEESSNEQLPQKLRKMAMKMDRTAQTLREGQFEKGLLLG